MGTPPRFPGRLAVHPRAPESGGSLLLARAPLTILWGMKQLLLVLCVALASTAVQAQKVYKIIHPDGTVEFTDTPPPDAPAQRIEVQPLNSAQPLAPPSGSSSQSANGAPAGYSQFRITSPTDGESIRDNAGNVNIDLSLQPTLRRGDKIDLYLDGQSIGGGRATGITLTDMDRGSHSIEAVVKNTNGQVVARSNSVTFTLQRRSAILQPARPTAVPFGGGRAN